MRFRPLPVLSTVSLLAFVALLGLGQWQWRRAGEKRATIAALAEAASRPALAFEVALTQLKRTGRIPEWRAIAPPKGQGCASAGSGPFLQALRVSDAGHREYLLPVGDAREGYLLVHIAEGPAGIHRLPAPCAFPDRLVLRQRILPGRFGIPNRPEADEFYWIDPDAMLSRAGLPIAAPGYYLAAPELVDPRTGGRRPNPRADPQAAQLLRPETHIGYSLTWFGLALALAALYVAMHVARGRLSFTARKS